MKLDVVEDRCPQCATALTRPEMGQAWCPACEWNLRIYDPAVVAARGWRRLDRWGHGLATRLDGTLFARFALERPSRPGWTAARIVLVTISTLLTLLTLACLGVGILLIVDGFPNWFMVPGVLLILVAVALRPRLGRPPRQGALRRERAPTLYALVDRVAAAARAPTPRIIAVTPDFNAGSGRVGMRRQTLLELGMALWITMPAQLRVALIAHEIGHTINGDPNRALVVQPALSTFRMVADASGADRSIGEVTRFRPELRIWVRFVVLIGGLLLWMVSRVFLLISVGLSALALRDHQRAEYLADAIAADVAGTGAAAELLDRLVLSPSIMHLIECNADTTPPKRWGALAGSLAARRTADLPVLRQLTERHTSLWSSHPPLGLRARLVEVRPASEPLVTLSEEDSRSIDQELAGWYAATHRRILGTRDYRELPARRATFS
ncbi:MAG TPA: M48 family metallopeptidase [Candidatus Dormibacteraeota bacterium]|nr:M48 family metallopeptidase [Candidatus Dormibacteraeota bacterium]